MSGEEGNGSEGNGSERNVTRKNCKINADIAEGRRAVGNFETYLGTDDSAVSM